MELFRISLVFLSLQEEEEEEVVVEGVEKEVVAPHHPQGLLGGLHHLDLEDMAVLRQEELKVIRHQIELEVIRHQAELEVILPQGNLEPDSVQLQALEAAYGHTLPEAGQLH